MTPMRCLVVPALAVAFLMAVPAQATEAIYQVRAIVAGEATPWYSFGLTAAALPGLDPADLPAPPPPPGAALDAWLVMNEPPAGLPNRWLGEFRTAHNSSLEVVDLWEFVVASPDLGTLCRIEVRPVAAVGYGERLTLLTPTGFGFDMSMGGAFEWPLSHFPVSLYLELRTGTPVPVEQSNWGSVKALFRR